MGGKALIAGAVYLLRLENIEDDDLCSAGNS